VNSFLNRRIGYVHLKKFCVATLVNCALLPFIDLNIHTWKVRVSFFVIHNKELHKVGSFYTYYNTLCYTEPIPYNTESQAGGRHSPTFTLVSCSSYSSTLKMEAKRSSETSVDLKRATRRYSPEDRSFQLSSPDLAVAKIGKNKSKKETIPVTGHGGP
jgi:hypothetical protein